MGEGERERVTEWESGLPAADDLPPLSQFLIPPGLASAFSISPEPCKTFLDVARESETTFAGLRSGTVGSSIQLPDDDLMGDDDEVVDDGDAAEDDGDRSCKLRRIDSVESETAEEGGKGGEGSSGAKRPRLVWTPQLHKRFVDVVAHLGIKNAVPKTIMQMMNVEGLTRENVASHLQKYRLYLKRMQGGPGGGEARPEQPQSNGNGSGDSNNSNSDGGSSNQVAFHPHQQSHQVAAFHPHHPGGGVMLPMPIPMQMPVPMPMYGHMGSSGGGGGGSSNHHHHHFHHHQHQFNGYHGGGAGGNGGNQSGFDAGFGFHGGSYPHHVPPSDA